MDKNGFIKLFNLDINPSAISVGYSNINKEHLDVNLYDLQYTQKFIKKMSVNNTFRVFFFQKLKLKNVKLC